MATSWRKIGLRVYIEWTYVKNEHFSCRPNSLLSSSAEGTSKNTAAHLHKAKNAADEISLPSTIKSNWIAAYGWDGGSSLPCTGYLSFLPVRIYMELAMHNGAGRRATACHLRRFVCPFAPHWISPRLKGSATHYASLVVSSRRRMNEGVSNPCFSPLKQSEKFPWLLSWANQPFFVADCFFSFSRLSPDCFWS